MADVRDFVEAQLERVEPKFRELYAYPTTLSSKLLANIKVVKVSRKLYRIPIELFAGGNARKVSSNEGGLGVGNHGKFDSLLDAYIPHDIAFRYSQEMEDTSKTTEQSVVDQVARLTANALKVGKWFDETTLFGDGTGKLTNASSSISGSDTLVFAGATDRLNVNRLLIGMAVEVWDSTGATKRVATNPNPIKSIDHSTNTVVLTNAVTALASGDLLAIPNLDVFGPATLVSFSSTWPATGVLGGFGGDSWRHGIYYAHDNTGANYYLSKLKSSFPALMAERVNGSSALLDFAMGYRLLGGIQQRRPDMNLLTGMIGIAHQAQRDQINRIGMSIANKLITGDSFGRPLDLAPTGWKQGEFTYCDIPCYVVPLQFKDRLDFLIPKNWYRAETVPQGFYPPGGGRKLFEGRVGSTGEVSTFWEFFLYGAYNFGCYDPGIEGFINSLALPSLWS